MTQIKNDKLFTIPPFGAFYVPKFRICFPLNWQFGRSPLSAIHVDDLIDN